MTAPIIRSIKAPESLQPGESGTVVIDAFDPDARTISIQGTVTDSSGNTGKGSASIVVGDPLTYELVCDDPGVTVVADPANPGVFTITT